MTRKDTIIIAVFVNAALLIALFITAIKGREEIDLSLREEKSIQSTPAIAKVESPMHKEVQTTQGDEIDQVLKEFSEKKTVAAEEKTPPKIDFAKELEAITKAATTVPKQPSARPSKEILEIKVQKGDSLEKIARVHGVKVNDIIDENNLSTTTLQIGQTLKIAGKKQTVQKITPSHSSAEEFYTVKQGDNPWTIAVKNHLKVDELLKLNNLNEEKARRLKPGDKLRIKR